VISHMDYVAMTLDRVTFKQSGISGNLKGRRPCLRKLIVANCSELVRALKNAALGLAFLLG